MLTSSPSTSAPGTDKTGMDFRRILPEIRCQSCLSPGSEPTPRGGFSPPGLPVAGLPCPRVVCPGVACPRFAAHTRAEHRFSTPTPRCFRLSWGCSGIVATMHLAERMSRIGVESAFDVLVRARALEAQGRSVIHLEIGEPDFPTPPHVVEAAKKALDEGWTHYGPTQGQPELREAIAAHISRTRGIQVGPRHVSVVPGGKPIIFFPMLALLEPGDEVVYPNPGFPIYESMIRFCGATPVPMRHPVMA